MNFFNFVNKYRVEEAKLLLLNSKKEHYSILGIANEAGFSSKSAFNTTFKKVTGQTPSDFKNRGSVL
jgi:AraC-like DNA-binding protein